MKKDHLQNEEADATPAITEVEVAQISFLVRKLSILGAAVDLGVHIADIRRALGKRARNLPAATLTTLRARLPSTHATVAAIYRGRP